MTHVSPAFGIIVNWLQADRLAANRYGVCRTVQRTVSSRDSFGAAASVVGELLPGRLP